MQFLSSPHATKLTSSMPTKKTFRNEVRETESCSFIVSMPIRSWFIAVSAVVVVVVAGHGKAGRLGPYITGPYSNEVVKSITVVLQHESALEIDYRF